MTKTILVIASLAMLTGCNSLACMLGCDVVTDNLIEADNSRHKYTLQYISETIPLISESKTLSDGKKAELLDMAGCLSRISEKENKLITGEE